jgi:hypothetical protein
MASPQMIRGGMLATLMLGWVSSLACFPFFSWRTAEESDRLAGNIHQEVSASTARLFVVGVDRTDRGRRYHLALRGYLVDRDPKSALRFAIEEERTAPLTVREKATTEISEVTGQEVRILHQSDLDHLREKNQKLDEKQALEVALDNIDGLPNAVLVEPDYRADDIAVKFSYRDQARTIRTGRLVLIPASVRRHPVLAQVNKLNYLWTVPVDVVVVVGGWSAFLVLVPVALVVSR